jgi:hypothetical protein
MSRVELVCIHESALVEQTRLNTAYFSHLVSRVGSHKEVS